MPLASETGLTSRGNILKGVLANKVEHRNIERPASINFLDVVFDRHFFRRRRDRMIIQVLIRLAPLWGIVLRKYKVLPISQISEN